MKYLILFALLTGTGCAPHRKPLPPPPPPPPIDQPVDLRSRLEGTWHRTARDQKGGQMTFRADGTVVFIGSLETSSPGQWELDPHRSELVLTLPQASDDTVAIFKMYLRDGVKAVDRPLKRITYHFDSDTERLNVAGWIYSRGEPVIIRSEAHTELE